MTLAEPSPAPARPTRWTAQWKELYEEVITTGLCTGCAGCVVVCPHDVIGYEHEERKYRPFHLEDELGLDDCVHGVKGCTSCTRACPRFRAWEPEADMHLFGRVREPDEMYGIYKDLLLCRASDDWVHTHGQDGGFVGSMLIWLLEEGYIEAALTSFLEGDGTSWKARPGLARTKEEVLASAGSRYTYSANTLALRDAEAAGLTKLALVGMSCQSSALPIMWSRKVGKSSRPFLFNIGLLCSKTFDDAIFEELFLAKYGLRKEDMVKMNIKGVFQIWMKRRLVPRDRPEGVPRLDPRGLQAVPRLLGRARGHLDRGHRRGQRLDPRGRAHRPRSRGGPAHASRPACIVSRPADTDEKAMKLLRMLSVVSRRRWPSFADPAPSVGVPPPKKKAAAPPADVAPPPEG